MAGLYVDARVGLVPCSGKKFRCRWYQALASSASGSPSVICAARSGSAVAASSFRSPTCRASLSTSLRSRFWRSLSTITCASVSAFTLKCTATCRFFRMYLSLKKKPSLQVYLHLGASLSLGFATHTHGIHHHHQPSGSLYHVHVVPEKRWASLGAVVDAS